MFLFKKDLDTVPVMNQYHFENITENITFSQIDVEILLPSLQHGKAAGIDGSSPKIPSVAAKELAAPITTLFMYSLDTGIVPPEWKTANAMPIYENGSKTPLTL